MKYNNFNNNNNNYFLNVNKILTLSDCFDYYQTKEKLGGKNKSYCNLCQQFFDSIFSTKIFYSPNVLIIILNREKENIYDYVKLNFQENINIDEYDFDKNIQISTIYDLYGVISNIAEFGSSSRFIANCKSPIDNNWYRFDDSDVSQINNIQQDVIEFGTPHILFYKKQKYRKDFFSKYKFN